MFRFRRFCYIGPQGIVHGTTLVLLNAGRKYLGSSDHVTAAAAVVKEAGDSDANKVAEVAVEVEVAASPLRGKVFVSAGLGGMVLLCAWCEWDLKRVRESGPREGWCHLCLRS